MGPRVLAQGGQLRGGHLSALAWPPEEPGVADTSVRSQSPRCRGGSKPGGLHGGGGVERGHGRRLQCGSQASGTAGVAGRGRWGRRWGCSRAWDRQGDPIALRAGPWGRQSQAGRPNSASGGGAGPRAFPVRGWGRLPGSPTLHRANSRTAGVPGAHTPQPRPLLGCGCAPLSRPSRNTRGAHCSPGCDACAPRLGPPLPGRSEPGMGLGPGDPRSPPSAGSCGCSALRAHGAGRGPAPVPRPGARASRTQPRAAGALLPGKWVQGARWSVSPPGSAARLRTHHLQAEVLGAGSGRGAAPAGRQHQQHQRQRRRRDLRPGARRPGHRDRRAGGRAAWRSPRPASRVPRAPLPAD